MGGVGTIKRATWIRWVVLAVTLPWFAGVAGAETAATCGVDAGQMGFPLVDLGVDRSVALSADGSTIAFAAPGLNALIVRDLGTGTESSLALPDGDVAAFPSLSGNGRRVAFTGLSEVCGRGGCLFLSKAYHADVATGTSHEVTPGHWSTFPQLSEDGRTLVYATGLDGGFQADSFVHRALVTGRERVVARHVRGWWQRPPSVSAHGGKVAYTAASIRGRPAQIQLYRVAAGTTQTLTDTLSHAASQPRMLSDGRRLTFVSRADIGDANPEHTLRTFLYDLGTRTTTALPALGGDAVLSGDAGRIAYTASSDLDGGNPEGNPEVFLFDRSTGTTSQLTSTVEGTPAVLAISRDGGSMAYVSARDDENFTMDLAVAQVCPGP